MKILMVCKGEYYEFMPAIADALKRQHGHSVSAMTFATPTAELKKMRVFDQIHNLAVYLKQRVPHYDIDECTVYLRDLELSGELENLNVMVYADRIIRNYPCDTVLKILAGVCRFWKQLFQELRPDAVVGEVACASEWIAWSFARQLNIQYLIPYPGPLPRRFYFIRSPAGRWDLAETLYQDIKERELSAEQTRLSEDLVSTFRAKRLRSAIHAPAFRSPAKLDRAALARLLQRAKRVTFRTRTYLEDGYFEVGSYNGTPPWDGVLQDLLRIVRHIVSETTVFETEAIKGKKIYFPLHVQPEFTIDVRAPFCTNQFALIENIAKSIPSGYHLVVKDHPGMSGSRRLNYYRDLQRLYNVQLVSPSIDSHRIIQSSDAVLTIVGTTAWEGILYEKPVIAFGPLAYGFFDQIYSCVNISDLPWILSEAIRGFRPDHKLLLKFVWAVLETAHDGEWHDPVASPGILEQANINSIANAIVRDIATRNNRQVATLPA
jgi:Capsule polysaccharide biosynthesis protein